MLFDGATLGRAVLSVWGSSASDVLAVGGPLGDDGEALALRFDGQTWRDLRAGGTETLWWASGVAADDVWLVGEHGRVLRFDGTALLEQERPTTATLFGVWAAAKDDAWAVGGSPAGPDDAPNDVVLHWDGARWSPEPLPGEPRHVALFKVWGSGPDDVWIVGEKGTIWHRTRGAWQLEPAPGVTGTLLTVSGSAPSDVWAVGGSDVLHFDGADWSRVDEVVWGFVSGVACRAGDRAVVVGDHGAKARLEGGVWRDDVAVPPHASLHSAWAAPDGAYWVAGGDYQSPAKPGRRRAGTIARFGTGTVPSTLAP